MSKNRLTPPTTSVFSPQNLLAVTLLLMAGIYCLREKPEAPEDRPGARPKMALPVKDKASDAPSYSLNTDTSLNHQSLPQKPKAATLDIASGRAVAIESQVKALEDCFYNGDCGKYENESPHEYADAIVQDLRLELSEIDQLGAEDNQWKENMIRRFLSFPDDRIKLEAIDRLATFKPSKENFETLLSATQESINAVVFKKSLAELKKYKDPADQKKVDDFLYKTIENGGVDAALIISAEILDFLNENNINRFKALQNRFQKSSVIGKNLRSNLNEYGRYNEGG